MLDTAVNELDRIRAKEDADALRRDLHRQRETMDRERQRWAAERAVLTGNNEALQRSLEAATAQRERLERQRQEAQRQADDARAEVAKLRRELTEAFDTRLSHLRSPHVSFDQYRALLGVAEQLQLALAEGSGGGGGGGGGGVDATLESARHYASAMDTARFDAPPSAHTDPLHPLHPRPSLPDGTVPDASPYRSPLRTASVASTPLATRSVAETTTAVPTGGAEVRESVVDGGRLVKITTGAADGAREWHFENTTGDTQFVVEFTFGHQSAVEPLGDAEADGPVLRLSLYPGERKPFCRGTVNGYRMAIRFGPPDTGFDPEAADPGSAAEAAVRRVRAALPEGQEGSAAGLREQCAAAGLPFADLGFAPTAASLAREWEPRAPAARWQPPEAVVPSGDAVELAVSGFGAGGPEGGPHGAGPWLVSAMRILATVPGAVQECLAATALAQGAVVARLCVAGWWATVTTDAFLPCAPGAPELLGARCASRRDLWPAALEKAMAKTHGSYAAITTGGDALEAIADVLGCPTQRLEWRSARDSQALGATFDSIAAAVAADDVAVVFSTDRQQPPPRAELARLGLRPGAGYRVVGTAVAAREATLPTATRLLLLLADPTAAASRHNRWVEDSATWATASDGLRSAATAALSRYRAGLGSAHSGHLVEGAAAAPQPVWVDLRDAVEALDGAGVALRRPQWRDLRLGNRFEATSPQWVLELSLPDGAAEPAEVLVSLHQPDRRGRAPDAPERTYGAFLLTCVAVNDAGVWDAVAQSREGTFWRGRDVAVTVTLRPGRPCYVVPRRHGDEEGPKDVVVAVRLERVVRTRVLRPTEGVLNAVRYSPVWQFDPEPCLPYDGPVRAQVDGAERRGLDWM